FFFIFLLLLLIQLSADLILINEYIYSFSFHDSFSSELYLLSLHDALPIFPSVASIHHAAQGVVLLHEVMEQRRADMPQHQQQEQDRKSTRLNSSHVKISYAVFCLKKKN